MTGVDADLASVRPPLEADATPIGRDWVEYAKALEAELSRLREQRDVARVFNEPGVGEVDPSDEIARLRREVDDKHGMMRAAIEDAEAAEARCARLQQALTETQKRASKAQQLIDDALWDLRVLIDKALAGPDTPAVWTQEELDEARETAKRRIEAFGWDTPADSQPEEPTP